MRSRTLLCPCEDVELRELEEAVERGYTDLEAIKRLTAVTTGPCQGSFCLRATIEALAALTDQEPGDVGTITHRPPSTGVPLGAVAQAPMQPLDPEEEPLDPEEAPLDPEEAPEAQGAERTPAGEGREPDAPGAPEAPGGPSDGDEPTEGST